MKSELDGYSAHKAAMVEKYSDATLSEYCEYFGKTYGKWVSNSTMCRSLKKQQLTLKKTLRSSQGAPKRVQKLRSEYWEKVKHVDPQNLVFLDECCRRKLPPANSR